MHLLGTIFELLKAESTWSKLLCKGFIIIFQISVTHWLADMVAFSPICSVMSAKRDDWSFEHSFICRNSFIPLIYVCNKILKGNCIGYTGICTRTNNVASISLLQILTGEKRRKFIISFPFQLELDISFLSTNYNNKFTYFLKTKNISCFQKFSLPRKAFKTCNASVNIHRYITMHKSKHKNM